MDPALISNPVEKQWVVEITKILDHQIEINREIPSVSIFHLPESITTKKPEAYEPQQIGLGPIHHFRPGPYRMMEQQKLVVMTKDLKESKTEDGKPIVLNKVRELVPIVRSCYDMFLQYEDESLAWIFAIDGLFLLNLFQTYNIGMGEKEEYLQYLEKKVGEFKQEKEQTNQNLFVVDEICESSYGVDAVIDMKESDEVCKSSYSEFMPGLSTVYIAGITPMKESDEVCKSSSEESPLMWPKLRLDRVHKSSDFLDQLSPPEKVVVTFMVLKEIYDGLHPSALSGSFSASEFRTFCKIHSPLKLCPKLQAPTKDVDHVLHYLYCSILNNTPSFTLQYSLNDCDEVFAECTLTISDIVNPIKFISKVPREEIIQVYEKTVSILESFTQTKILIPSASKLHNRAGFMFKVLDKHQGIQNIYKNDKDIYLPCVTLNIDSEVILRNLVAYETLTANPDKFPLTEYMGLMCALIVNVDDVKYLRDQKVIDGDMGNDEVAKLFIGMTTSIKPIITKEKSDLREMIDEINSVYNIRLEMKMYLHLKKLARWLLVGLKDIGKFVEDSWKIAAFMISIVTVFMLTYQAYCDVYGCDKKAVTLLPYASS